MLVVHPIHVRSGEVVDIHWHCPEGIYIERREVPPKATREAKQKTDDIQQSER